MKTREEEKKIAILDSTLREGEQSPGVCFDSHIKIAIAELLDEIGVDYIEAGHPTVSESISKDIKILTKRNLRAVLGAHARSLKKDIDKALDSGVDFIGVFFCVAEGRLNNLYKKSIEEAITQISNIIEYTKKRNPDIVLRFTPEDTVRSEDSNVIRTSAAAVKAGADIISIADTTGYMIPGTDRNMYDYIKNFRGAMNEKGLDPKIAIHCHNDRGLALANVLDAFRAGVDIIDTSILSLGERAGIVDLAQLLVILKEDFKVNNNWNLKKLPGLYNLVSQYANIKIQDNFPLMGKNSFSHCAGVHAQAALVNPNYYQSLDPAVIGRKIRIVLDQKSGHSTIKHYLELLNKHEVSEDIITQILNKVKDIGHRGRCIDLEEFKYILKLFIKD